MYARTKTNGRRPRGVVETLHAGGRAARAATDGAQRIDEARRVGDRQPVQQQSIDAEGGQRADVLLALAARMLLISKWIALCA